MVVVVVALIFIYPLFNETRSSSIKRNFVSFPLCQIRLDTQPLQSISQNSTALFHTFLEERLEDSSPSCFEASSRRGFAVTTRQLIYTQQTRVCVCVCTHVPSKSPPLLSPLLSYVQQSVIVVPPRCFSRRLQCDLSGDWDGVETGSDQ